MDGKAESRETAPSFEAAGDVVGQRNPLQRDPKNHFARFDHDKVPVLDMDAAGDVLEAGVVLNVVDLGALLEYSEIVPEREVDRPGSDLRRIERLDSNRSVLQSLLD